MTPELSKLDQLARELSILRDAWVEASLALKEYQFAIDAAKRRVADSEAGEVISRAQSREE